MVYRLPFHPPYSKHRGYDAMAGHLAKNKNRTVGYNRQLASYVIMQSITSSILTMTKQSYEQNHYFRIQSSPDETDLPPDEEIGEN